LRGRDLVALLRPWQWSKNGIVFAGIIFSQNLLDPRFVLRSLAGFVVFCIASSAVYVLNDVRDVERDRLHPEKRGRPVASGRVSPAAAYLIAALLAAVAVVAACFLGTPFLLALIVFLVVNAAYSVWLRNVVILDVMLIAISFVARAVAGVMVLRPVDAAIELSPWLLVCTFFLALFLALGKRRHELALLEGQASGHRGSLGDYSLAFLDQMISTVTAATLIAYAIYTIAPGTVSKFHSPALVVTLPFVGYGIFRYLFLLRERQEGGNPSRLLYRDTPLWVTIVAWLAVVIVVLYQGAR
jgi:4-hydroxybenzoate polyprenyltransferase